MIKKISVRDEKNIKQFYNQYDKNFSEYLLADGHKIYYEECGNKNGIPVVYVHGGPGGTSYELGRQFFDKDKYRLIIIDQRGCGRSEPFLKLENNTTHHLVEDMQKIKEKLNIDKWIVFGGSWGTTLSLCYAIKYPESVSKLILRGIFLGRREDIDWLYQDGASNIFPDTFEEYREALNNEEQKNIVSSYYKYLTSDDKKVVEKYAMLWSQWENSCVALYPRPRIEKLSKDDISLAVLECHYFVNHSFIPDNYILNNVDKIKDIKTYIVHGRYDIDCRMKGAYELYKSLDNAELYIVNDAGHTSFDEGIRHTLISILDEI